MGEVFNMDEIYDLIIVGSGPAGLTAAIYAMRAKLNTLVIEESGVSGGQVLTTYDVDNYPGMPGISGYDLAMKMKAHADKLGSSYAEGTVLEIKEEGSLKTIVTSNGNYAARAVIIATGATHAKLLVPGEEEFAGMGVSYCATCDGAFFKNKITAVVGGGDVAVEDAIFLARFCEKVYLIHRRNELRAAGILQDALKATSKIEMVWDSTVTGIQGTEQVDGITIKNVKTNAEKKLKVNGVFVAVGIHPNTEAYRSLLKTNQGGYIVADETGVTNIPGIFAAGDARAKQLRQIVTAVSDGANAVTSVQDYFLKEIKL